MSMMKRWLVRVGLWLAHRGGWRQPLPVPCRRAHLPADDYVELATKVCADVQARIGSAPAEVKRREALLALMNICPDQSQRTLNLWIELALQ